MSFASRLVVAALALFLGLASSTPSSAQPARRRDLARGLDRADAVDACLRTSNAIDSELQIYMDALARRPDWARRYIAGHAPPMPGGCETALLRRAPDPWDDVAEEMERYAAARDALYRAMLAFQEAVRPLHTVPADLENANQRLAAADAGLVAAHHRLIDVLYVRMRPVERLFERELASDRTRVDDIAVFRMYEAVQELQHVWLHAADDGPSRDAVSRAISELRRLATELPGEAGTMRFRDAVRELDQELGSMASAPVLPTIEPERVRSLRSAVASAYDECAPTVRLPQLRH